VRLHIHTHTHTHTQTPPRTGRYKVDANRNTRAVYTYVHVYICIYMHIHRDTLMHKFIYTYISINMYIYIHTNICKYRHIYKRIYIFNTAPSVTGHDEVGPHQNARARGAQGAARKIPRTLPRAPGSGLCVHVFVCVCV